MDKVNKRFNRIMNISLLMILLNLIVGFVFIFFTNIALKVSLVMLGGLITIKGLYSLIRYFYDGLANKVFVADLFYGLVSVALGLLLIFYPTDISNFIGVGFGLWLLFNGLVKGFYSLKFMKNNEEIYPLVGFIAVLLIIMGLSTIINPFSGFMIITKLIGIFLICASLFEGMVCSLFKKRAQSILDIFE